VLCAVTVIPALATQYNPPWADVFSFAYPNDATGKGLYTKVSGDNAVAQLSGAGYHTFDNNLVSAIGSMGGAYAQVDAVWAHLGHGRAGAALFWDGTQYSELMADSSMNPLSSSWGKAYITAVTGLEDLRLMVFGECHTANNGTTTGLYHGNLLDAATARGVDSVLGFADLVYWPAMDYWSNAFFLTLRNGHTVDESAVNAEGYVLYALGAYFGTDSWRTRHGTSKIMPVGYGS
jgi:hypothetical protein